MERTALQRFSDFSERTRYDALPAAAVASIKERILDTVGLCLAAVPMDTSRMAAELGASWGGQPEASTIGFQAWGDPHLVPITRGEPVDGILDLIFQGVVPTNPAELGPFMQIEALLPVETGHPYKGVRVRSGHNAITLKMLPGYAEIAGPKEDCAKCRGKFFVAKGAQPPAGAAADNVVREADLP